MTAGRRTGRLAAGGPAFVDAVDVERPVEPFPEPGFGSRSCVVVLGGEPLPRCCYGEGPELSEGEGEIAAVGEGPGSAGPSVGRVQRPSLHRLPVAELHQEA